jgi:hypothetical protein
MFILYAILAGLLLGLLSGGSAERLGRLRFRWGALIAVGMAVQLSLFSSPVGAWLGDAAPAVYILSNVMVLIAVTVNLAIRGLALVMAGGGSNLLAIVANGGYMPVSPEALAAMGRAPQDGFSNSILMDHVNLAPLTDIFAMPTFIPAANVFSIGDVLIGVGAAVALVVSMRGGTHDDDVIAPAGADPGSIDRGAPAH